MDRGFNREDLAHGRCLPTLFVGLVMVAQFWGCGTKGPPLAPFVRVPAAVTELAVRRLGDEVFLGFTLPTQNQDGTEPADLVRVDVYAMTTQPRMPLDRTLSLEEFEEAATLVASIEVSASPPEVNSSEADPETEAQDAAPSAQGFPVAVAETLTAETLLPVDPWEDEREDEEDADDEELGRPLIVPLMTPLLPGPLQREYAVVGVSSKGDEGEAATRPAVPLVDPPVPPSRFAITYSELAVNIMWDLPVGVRSTVHAPTPAPAPTGPSFTTQSVAALTAFSAQATVETSPTTPLPAGTAQTPTGASPATAAAGEPTETSTPEGPVLPSSPIRDWPPASQYDLFEVIESEDGPLTMPVPLNTTPLITPEYADTRVMEFGIKRCYAVVTYDVVGVLDLRSRMSEPTCVMLFDTFPPAAPVGLTAVGGAGAVSLIWQSNEEEDLAGYLVLRGLPSGETLQPLTPEPVPENTYRDATAEPGVRYVYAVRAVDMAVPSNVSPASNEATDAAR
jgi:hypothetical protein